jgi:murein DD-endopeptidase MepM/ murein hydrolase activator NlpD
MPPEEAAEVVLVSTAILTPTPLPPPTPTPTIEAMPIPTPAGPAFTYHTISTGETLGYLAFQYGTTIEQLVRMNQLSGPAALIQVDQTLRVPLPTDQRSPDQFLLPDSEVVYSPAYLDFDVADFVHSQGGYLSTYSQYVDNREVTGPEIVVKVAEQFGVGPRLLLALLEHYSGWVTDPNPPEALLNQPLGPRNPRGGDLHRALGFTANRINAGYYGYKRDGFWVFELADRSRAITPEGLNAGTVGVQNILAIHADWETWQTDLGPAGFLADYEALFGDPLAYTFEPVVPITLAQPELTLPWPEGEGFYLTSGPHPAYAHGSAWAALDFGPPDVLGNCYYSSVPATAAADGVVVAVRQGEVYLDLDGDGHIQTGWVLQYLHVALDSESPVQVGQEVSQGDVIGYASCEGGLANSSHVHLARRYNGEWIAADGPVPLVLSGWVTQPTLNVYDGSMAKGAEVRQACECWDDSLNLIIHTPEE